MKLFVDTHRASNDSPATIISTSSPECEERVTSLQYPGLKLISMEEAGGDVERTTNSPEIPVLCPTPIKGKIVTHNFFYYYYL